MKKNVKKIGKLLSFVAVVIFSFPALAAQKLSIRTYGYLVKTVISKDGKKKEKIIKLPPKVYPQDIIEYRIVCKNTSKETLKDIIIKAKIPEGTSYIPGSATGNPEFSIDHGKTFHREPVKYMVYEKGKAVQKIATPDMYTNIRWKIPYLYAEKVKTFRYRVYVGKLIQSKGKTKATGEEK